MSEPKSKAERKEAAWAEHERVVRAARAEYERVVRAAGVEYLRKARAIEEEPCRRSARTTRSEDGGPRTDGRRTRREGAAEVQARLGPSDRLQEGLPEVRGGEPVTPVVHAEGPCPDCGFRNDEMVDPPKEQVPDDVAAVLEGLHLSSSHRLWKVVRPLVKEVREMVDGIDSEPLASTVDRTLADGWRKLLEPVEALLKEV